MHLSMEIRSVDIPERSISGIVAPYDETTYLVMDPSGERIKHGAFTKSIRQRETRIPLIVGHDHGHRRGAVGFSRSWTDTADGLAAVFGIRADAVGDEVLEDVKSGYLPAMSVGFEPLTRTRAANGVLEVREAKLMEVSLVIVGAYDGAKVLAARTMVDIGALLAPFANPPAVDLSPVPNWY
jgi:HK97 family phage prohead protease